MKFRKNGLKISFLIIVFVVFSCKKKLGKPIYPESDSSFVSNNSFVQDSKFIIEHEILKDPLVGIQEIDSEKKDPFRRFGLDATTECYSCDIAVFKIDQNDKKLYVIGNCLRDMKISNETKNNYQILDIKTILIEKNKYIKINLNEEHYLAFSKIDSLHVYKIMTSNALEERIKGLKIPNYYVLNTEINKFDIAECDDFDG